MGCYTKANLRLKFNYSGPPSLFQIPPRPLGGVAGPIDGGPGGDGRGGGGGGVPARARMGGGGGPTPTD